MADLNNGNLLVNIPKNINELNIFSDDDPCRTKLLVKENTLNPTKPLIEDVFSDDEVDILTSTKVTAFGDEIECLPSAEALNNCDALNPVETIESSKKEEPKEEKKEKKGGVFGKSMRKPAKDTSSSSDDKGST